VLFVACAISSDRPKRTVPTPVPSASPGFENGGPCPPVSDPSVPEDSGCLTEAVGDFDGDGRDDRLLVYATVGRGALPRSWHMRAVLASGGSEISLKATRESYPVAIGSVDADGDARAEAFVKTKDFLFHSAGSSVVGLFQIEDGALQQVETETGDPFEIRVGGITQLGEGADCRDLDEESPKLILLRIWTYDHSFKTWRFSKRIFEWQGNELAQNRRVQGTIEATDYIDPDVRRFYSIRCGDFDPTYPY
jgi:hypothetical protein